MNTNFAAYTHTPSQKAYFFLLLLSPLSQLYSRLSSQLVSWSQPSLFRLAAACFCVALFILLLSLLIIFSPLGWASSRK